MPAPLTRQDAVRNSERIVTAAREVFARSGLDASLDEVARQAGVGVATVYRRFADKEQLIDALFESRIDRVAALAEAALADPDPWAGITGFVYGTASELAQDRGFMHLLLSRSHGQARTEQARDRMAPLATRMAQRAVDAGVLRPEIVAQDLPLIQILLSGVMDASRELSPELWRRYAALILDGMRAEGIPRVPLDQPPVEIDQLPELMQSWHPCARPG